MSSAIFAKKVITIITQNKERGISTENGLKRNVRSRRFPTNLMTRNTHICKHSLCAVGDTPQSTVRNTSSFLRKRVNNCIGTTTDVPNISQFLRSQHLKNNCLPEQNMHFTKILKPKNCYASNAGC